MIKIDFSKLPWLPLDEKSAFPRSPAIYFAIDSQDNVQYIGISKDPKKRWGKHHKFADLARIGGVKIVYMFVEDRLRMRSLESRLIAQFKPPLNTFTPIESSDAGAHILSVTIDGRVFNDMRLVSRWKGIPVATHLRQVVEQVHESEEYQYQVGEARRVDKKAILEAIAELAAKENVSIAQLKRELLAEGGNEV